ncbi:DUF5681 domain-containing protein [Sphingomonas profundi]|uniref:DUF5681 domain-containing protein n=1 Tax=Alterirhizorhabdus profundi TaxID=2681549 RepID=UPI0012E979C1|nr:DUF5681 domain-containing protein [Sphingomonas profundi]
MSDDPPAVGYKRPPKHSQWKPGQSGNQGRRKVTVKAGTIDPSAILDAPISMRVGDKVVELDPYEANFTALTRKAMTGCLKSAKTVLQACAQAGIINEPEGQRGDGVVLTIPKEWDNVEWMDMYKRFGPPPWQGERDGLVPADRRDRP